MSAIKYQPKRAQAKIISLQPRDIIVEILGVKTNELPTVANVTANHLFVVADNVSGDAFQATFDQLRAALSISFKIIELTVGDASQAKPSGPPTPANGATDVVLNYKVIAESERISHNGSPVRPAPSYDLSFQVIAYGATTTTYRFNQPLSAGSACFLTSQ